MKLRYFIGSKLTWLNLLLSCCDYRWQLVYTSKYPAAVKVPASTGESVIAKGPVTFKHRHCQTLS